MNASKRLERIRETYLDRLLSVGEILLDPQDMRVILQMVEKSQVGELLVVRILSYVIGRAYGIIPAPVPPDGKGETVA